MAKSLLQAVRKRARASNETMIEHYAQASVEVAKTSHTGAEVLALKKLIQTQQTQQDTLREEIKHNRATLDFLANCLVPIPPDVRVEGRGRAGWAGIVAPNAQLTPTASARTVHLSPF